jgi:hypothetical protein
VTIRYLADENIEIDILRGLRSREPAIEILDVKTDGLRGTKDPALLKIAIEQDRILITHDRNTMTRHYYEHLAAGKAAPGLFIVPKQPSSIGVTIETPLLLWAAAQAEEWRNQIVYLLFR